jgi:hypothetical protein
MIIKTHMSGFVVRTIHALGGHGISCALFGGWAEEALGLVPPRAHADIDLLLLAPSFETLDSLLISAPDEFKEIPLKRFTHKRGFLVDGIMVETTLVTQVNETAATLFWGDVRFDWLMPLTTLGCLKEYPLQITTVENLRHHRANFRQTQPHRWRDAASVVDCK